MFNSNTLDSPKAWLEAGFRVFPCSGKVPKKNIKWSSENYSEKDFNKSDNIGLVLKGVSDFDVDNPVAHRFIKEYLKGCGTIYGRKSNPNSHLLFKGDNPFKQFVVPKSLENHFKEYSHGITLGEIRNGDHYSIVPNSKINGESVEWSKFVELREYDGALTQDIGLIMFSTAMAILYPRKGQRDNFCSAIAGALANNTDWSGSYIDTIVFNIAKNAVQTDENYMKKNGKGTNARNAIKGKKRILGMPKLSEILNVPVSDTAELFSWVGLKNEGRLFSDLIVYNTIPKYYELKVKGKKIRVMNTKDLMSYASIQVIIEEQLLETAPLIKPKEWREIRQGLYQSARKVDVPFEQSFFGVIAGHFVDFCTDRHSTKYKKELFELHSGLVWNDSDENRYVFRLDDFTKILRNARLSFEQRQLTAMLTEYFKSRPIKLHYNSKELRCWEVPVKAIERFKNGDNEFATKLVHDRMDNDRRTPNPY